jgi:hypothetical protein
MESKMGSRRIAFIAISIIYTIVLVILISLGVEETQLSQLHHFVPQLPKFPLISENGSRYSGLSVGRNST